MRSTFDLPDLDSTIAFGRALGQKLQPDDVVALIGSLGAGKTHLVRAIAEGLGIPDSRVVSSPTFTLIHEYKGRLPIFHFDVYRLKSPAEFVDLGVAEYFEAGGVCLIEWADRVLEYLPKRRITIELEITGETSRRLTIDEPSEPRTK
jgi:tRNA threonylcarbamoyladenosine biosynthesis protein TsaE